MSSILSDILTSYKKNCHQIVRLHCGNTSMHQITKGLMSFHESDVVIVVRVKENVTGF